MIDHNGFQKQLQKIGELVQEMESIADPAVRARAKELVQHLMDIHGAGLERIMELVFQSGQAGSQTIDDLGHDPLVSSLLVLYGLHPDPLQTRVERGLQGIDSKLNKVGAAAALITVDDGNVRVRVTTEGHTCGSSGRTAQAMVEEAIYNSAPDLKSLVVEGAEEAVASGFVAMETLLRGPHAPVPSIGTEAAVHQSSSFSEGMD